MVGVSASGWTRGLRYERKFTTDRMDRVQVGALVMRHPALFFQPFPPRTVNNFYLDTEELSSYQDNVSGVPKRHKVRVRWYGDLFGTVERPTLELKTKCGLVGDKHHYPLPPFRLVDQLDQRRFHQFLAGAELPPEVRWPLKGRRVVLCNRYHRRYYATRDGRFRVTVDSELAYFQVRPSGTGFRHRYLDPRHVVVELKYDPVHEPDAGRVANRFPFPVTKNSKYVTGIERVYL